MRYNNYSSSDNTKLLLNGAIVQSGKHYPCKVESTDRNRLAPPNYDYGDTNEERV